MNLHWNVYAPLCSQRVNETDTSPLFKVNFVRFRAGYAYIETNVMYPF